MTGSRPGSQEGEVGDSDLDMVYGDKLKVLKENRLVLLALTFQNSIYFIIMASWSHLGMPPTAR